ncbi:hypothetical protein HPB48_002664 [Haemaphysalis longicornis]|uniref:THAP9-like helix-turn-helix domain-containing protein n=1 Tax=Haemaphysalis longicornis TaxID=44386 RepID=A0A9J6GUJ7_HAELO|nr:hypothetical protein HPB48_002664 [Haemaphysalis longicornis]
MLRRCSPDVMLFARRLFTISPRAYRYIRSSGHIILPHPVTIRSVCSSFKINPQLEDQPSTFLRYVAKRISDLDDRQRVVTLMVDESHIKPFFEYKGKNICGIAHNSPEAANSALVFFGSERHVKIQR